VPEPSCGEVDGRLPIRERTNHPRATPDLAQERAVGSDTRPALFWEGVVAQRLLHPRFSNAGGPGQARPPQLVSHSDRFSRAATMSAGMDRLEIEFALEATAARGSPCLDCRGGGSLAAYRCGRRTAYMDMRERLTARRRLCGMRLDAIRTTVHLSVFRGRSGGPSKVLPTWADLLWLPPLTFRCLSFSIENSVS
jgi:hypothetical protein